MNSFNLAVTAPMLEKMRAQRPRRDQLTRAQRSIVTISGGEEDNGRSRDQALTHRGAKVRSLGVGGGYIIP